jgi:hypothetical protein
MKMLTHWFSAYAANMSKLISIHSYCSSDLRINQAENRIAEFQRH